MQKCYVSEALKLLPNNMRNRILPLNKDTLILIDRKHPEAKEIHDEILLDNPL